MGNCGSSPSSTPAAADLFGLLPDDLVTDILSRIPTRQLRHCNTVCKRWHSLLGTPSFAQEHEKQPASSSIPLVHRDFVLVPQKRKRNESRLVFFKDSKYTRFRAVRLNHDAKKKMISWPLSQLRASYHGLLLFREHHSDSTHCILNPLTGEVVTFTNPGRVCGLYYHPPNRQYRLLCFREVTAVGTGTGSSFLYYVCSTSQELIKEVGTSDFVTEDELSRAVVNPGVQNIPAVAAGSFLYWLAYKSNESDRYIMTFDVINETLQFMPHGPHQIVYPEGPSWLLQRWSTQLFEVGNQLHLYVGDQEIDWIEVWALQDHKTWSWNKVFALHLALSIRDIDIKPHLATRDLLPLTVEDGELLYFLPG